MVLRLLWLVGALLGMVGCSASSSYTDFETDIEQRMQALNRTGLPKDGEVSGQPALEHGFVTPPLQSLAPFPPRWADHPVEFAVHELTLSELLTDLMLDVGVAIRFVDSIDTAQQLSLYFSGTLRDALIQLQLLTGLHFEGHDYVLTVRRYEVAEFDVAYLAGSTRFFLGQDTSVAQGQRLPDGIARGVTGSHLSSATGSANSQYLNFASSDLSLWDDLQQALALLLSEQGKLVINQSSTSVLVRDYPQNVGQVRAYLMQQNQRLTRQVAIDIQVIDVLFNDEQQTGIDWEMIYQRTANSSIVNFSSAAISSLAANTASSELGLEWGSGRLAGSRVLLSALAQQGVVEVSSHPRVVSLNNQVARIVLEDNATYLASTGSTSTANVGSSELLIPGVVTTGFELYVLPKVANNQVVMQLSTSLSELTGMEQVSSGERTIQTPQTNRKTFFMQAMVGDGETLLISGLQSSRRQWREQRNLLSWLFGGRQQSQERRSETILLLTPRILPTGVVL